MAYEPLHHKYRPQRFIELVGQEAIAQTLTHAIESGRIAPAYLFTGPRGTGKTSSARILSKSLNCLQSDTPTANPCGKCEVCLQIARGSAMDVIEIDAASNTGVDNIREIIERAQFAPVQCRYKVYVIDECHMLSTPAFNALLKTLEEPPNRVIFVLATTDPQRVLNTIISRCQRFDFRRIPLESMVKHLTHIAAKEEINIAGDALTLVAQIANGGLRDAESLLDQLSLIPDEVTVEKVWDLVGAVPERDLLALIRAIHSDDPEATIAQCRHLMDRGREPLIVLQNLATFYLNLLIAKTSPQRNDLVAVTAPTWQELCEEAKQWNISVILQGQQKLKESEVQIKNTTQPRLWLEVTLLGLLPSAIAAFISTNTTTQNNQNKTTDRSNTQPRQPLQNSPRSQVSQSPSPLEKSSPPKIEQSVKPTEKSLPEVKQSPQPIAKSRPTRTLSEEERLQKINEQTWKDVIAMIEKIDVRIFAEQKCYLISLDYEKSVACLGLTSANLANIAKSKKTPIEIAFKEVCWQDIKVEFQVEKKNNIPRVESNSSTIAKKNDLPPTRPPNSSVKAIAQPASEVKTQPVPQNGTIKNKENIAVTPSSTVQKIENKETTYKSQVREQLEEKRQRDRISPTSDTSKPQPQPFVEIPTPKLQPDEQEITESYTEEENETIQAANEFASVFEGEVLDLEAKFLENLSKQDDNSNVPDLQVSSQPVENSTPPPEEDPNDIPF
ncbi:MAG: DNA polymerase III subunit gamma/tau [Cyanobacteria bacterium SBLK]|nr:DNA polymerase III subunit gamma/tau [Cyanobacteria bacterium SBLK]